MKYLKDPDTLLVWRLSLKNKDFGGKKDFFFFLFHSNLRKFASYGILLLVCNNILFKYD